MLIRSCYLKKVVVILDKLFTKDHLIIAIVVIAILVQSGYFATFATKLDVANLRTEMLQMKVELKKYADDGDRELLHNLDEKYNQILTKLDRYHSK